MILSSDDDRVFARGGSLIDGSTRMGAGNDETAVEAGATIRGDILPGTGDHRFVFERSMLQTVLTSFGIVDGGSNFNIAVFRGFGLDALRTRAVAGGFFVSLVTGPRASGGRS